MTKKRSYTVLTPEQRLMLAQVKLAFPKAKVTDIARVAGVSTGTVYNVLLPLLETAHTVPGRPTE